MHPAGCVSPVSGRYAGDTHRFADACPLFCIYPARKSRLPSGTPALRRIP